MKLEAWAFGAGWEPAQATLKNYYFNTAQARSARRLEPSHGLRMAWLP